MLAAKCKLYVITLTLRSFIADYSFSYELEKAVTVLDCFESSPTGEHERRRKHSFEL